MRARSQKAPPGSTATLHSSSGVNRFLQSYAGPSRIASQSDLTLKVREKHAQQKQQQQQRENLVPKTKNVVKTKDLLPAATKRAVGATPNASHFAEKLPTPSHKLPSVDEKENPYIFEDVKCNPEDNYELTDTEASDYDADSDEEYERRSHKHQPSWARSENLRKALAQQHSLEYTYDPDVLFGEVETCDLVEIFSVTDNIKKKRLRHRRSSGKWDNDRLTEKEKTNYKRQVRAMLTRSNGH